MSRKVPFLVITALTYGYLSTKAREAWARAHAAEAALGSLSEEVRTPLVAIVRYSDMLRGDRLRNLTAAQQEGIARINTEAVEVLEIIVRRLYDVLAGPPTEHGPWPPPNMRRP